MSAIIVATVLAYLPGLDGPFLFDDPPNILVPFQAWLDGKTGWQELVLGNHSGILGRPLSMLTFVANASTSGLNAVAFKSTNLIIHLLCGFLIYRLLRVLLLRDPLLRGKAQATALVIAAIWLLHPIQVSTVLYVVQRMAQLSTLFIFISLVAYVAGRRAIEHGKHRLSLAHLFVSFPAATLAAMACKENGALAPLLCAVVELGYFRPNNGEHRPTTVKAFFAAFLVIPGTFLAAMLALRPQFLLGGYEGRLFTLGERLLSEPRALFDYIGILLLPRGPSLGLYTDDFPISHGLFDPPSTMWAILGLMALAASGLRFRRTIPAVFTGLGLFLAGHAMESTVFPLELYFEHRNYLPAFGLFLALAGAVSWLGQRLAQAGNPRVDTLGKLALGAVIVLLSLATAARSSVWSSWPALAEQGISQHPQSLRAHLDQISMLLAQSRNEEALDAYRGLAKLSNPAASNVSALGTVYLQCRNQGRTTPEDVARIGRLVGQKLQLPELLAAENLANELIRKECDGMAKEKLAAILRDAADSSGQPDRLTQIWRVRFVAARLFLDAHQLELAQEQAALAWMSGAADPAVGVFLANVYYLLNRPESARVIVVDVGRRLRPWDRRNRQLLSELERNFEPHAATPGRSGTIPGNPDSR